MTLPLLAVVALGGACNDLPTAESPLEPRDAHANMLIAGGVPIRAGERAMVYLTRTNTPGCAAVSVSGAVNQQIYAQVGSCGGGGSALGTVVQSARATADGTLEFHIAGAGTAHGRVTVMSNAVQTYLVDLDDAAADGDFDDVQLRVEVHADVTDFGAVPNDHGDDAPAIQSVLSNASYPSVYFAPGTYAIDQMLMVPGRSGIRLWGAVNPDDGSLPSRLYRRTIPATEKHILSTYGGSTVTGLTVEQIFFQGEFIAGAFALRLVEGDSIRFRNNRVRNIGAFQSAPPGLGANPNRYIWVDDNLIDNDPTGYILEGAVAIRIEYSQHAWVTRNRIYNVTHAVMIWGGGADPRKGNFLPTNNLWDATVANNTIVNVGDGVVVSRGERVVVRGNYVEKCRDVCLDAESGHDILFEGNTAKYAGTSVLSTFFDASYIRFVENDVEQRGMVPDFPEGGKTMFDTYREPEELTNPANIVVLLHGNTFNYTGATGLGMLSKHATRRSEVKWNQLTNSVIDMDSENSGPMDVSENVLTFTRSTESVPPIEVGNTHLGQTVMGELVVIHNTINSSVPQLMPAIVASQSATGGTIGTTILDNVVSTHFPASVSFRNDGSTHQWYINNNGGPSRIMQTGNAFPYLVVTPN